MAGAPWVCIKKPQCGQLSCPSTLLHGACTHPLQELNDGFLALLCSAVEVLQPELQLSPCVFEHTCVPKNLLAVEPCEGQRRTYFLFSCTSFKPTCQSTAPAILPGRETSLLSTEGQDHSMPYWGQHGSFLTTVYSLSFP